LGATNKTITWNNATDGWEFNQPITVIGNIIKSSSATALTLSGAHVEVAGDLTVTGNDIKSSGGTTALSISGNDVTVLGDLDVNAGTIGTIATTGNLFNTAATTVNIAGAGTTVNIGAATGTTTIGNNLSVNGTTLTLDANNAGAGVNSTIAANRGSSGADATLVWDESTGFWTFNNNVYGSDQIVGGNSIGTNGNNIYFNNEDGGTGATSNLTVKRGTENDVTLRWFESPISSVYDRWQTTTDGTNYINIPDQALDILSSVKFEKITSYNISDIDCNSFYASVGPIQETVITSTRKVMKCLVHISQGNAVHCVEALVLGTSSTTAMLTTYGEMYDTGPLATFAADCSSGSIRLRATPTNNSGSMLFSAVITSLT
jgi:hypothetical protein